MSGTAERPFTSWIEKIECSYPCLNKTVATIHHTRPNQEQNQKKIQKLLRQNQQIVLLNHMCKPVAYKIPK